MRSYLSKCLMLSLAGCAMMATGCVSEQQYKEALAASRRANEQLVNSQNALRDVRKENQALQEAVTGRDAIITARNAALGQMRAAHDKLNDDFKNLYAKYQRAVTSTTVQPIGSIVLPAALDKALREFARNNPGLLEYLPQYGMVKLKSDLTFQPGSVNIKTTSGDALRQFAQILNDPAAAKFNIYIAGHTDDIPIKKDATRQKHPDNWYLSVHRAVAVQKVMSAAGIDSKRIGALGFSKYHPVAANAPGNKGNVANRRVELWIVPPDRFLTARGR